MEKDIKKIFKRYKKILNKYHKNFWREYNCVNYFITYLKFLRDMLILKSKINPEDDAIIISICCAIVEYYNSINCINSFYNISNRSINYIDSSIDKKSVDDVYCATRLQHLTRFLTLVRDNIDN